MRGQPGETRGFSYFCVKAANIKQSQFMRAGECIEENCVYGKLNSGMHECSNQVYSLSSPWAVESCAAQVTGYATENATNMAGGRT